MRLRGKNRYWLVLVLILAVIYYRPFVNYVNSRIAEYRSQVVVQNYLDALATAYMKNDPSLIEPYVSQDEYSITVRDMAATERRGERLISTLTDLKKAFFGREGAESTLNVEESWRYRYVDARTGRTVKPEVRERYLTRYTLKDDVDGHLIISKIFVESRL